MSELVEFLRARLMADERTAQAVEDHSAPWPGQWENDNGRALRTHNGHVLAYLPNARPFKPGVLDHIARHDPARVLREVEAKRRMLDELYPEVKGADESIEGEWNSNPYNADTLLELLALPYADHPDYREEWRP